MQIGNVFDGLLLVVLFVCVVLWPTHWITDKQNRWLRIAAVGLIAIQLLFGGPRFQLLPAYLVGATFLIRLIPRRTVDTPFPSVKESIGKKLSRWTMVFASGFALLIAVVLCALFPRFQFPNPGGDYAVGVHEFRLTDALRAEPNTQNSNDRREISVRATYPADGNESLERDSVVSYATSVPITLFRAMSANSTVAKMIPQSWGRVRTHGWTDANVAKGQASFPVIIFSHGNGALPDQYVVLTEELASRGYIVLSINHPGISGSFESSADAAFGIYENSRQSRSLPLSKEQRDRYRGLAEKISEPGLSIEAQMEITREEIAVRPEAKELTAASHQLASDDQKFLLGQLAKLQADDPLLRGRLDLERVGVIGMSLGGTASHLTCVQDARCRAGVNLDGFQPWIIDQPPLAVPFMHMAAESNTRMAIPHQQSQAPSYVVRVTGSAHGSYTDLGLGIPLLRKLDERGTPVVGTIQGERMRAIVNDYVTAFFDKHLKGVHRPLLESPSNSYPEVVFLSK